MIFFQNIYTLLTTRNILKLEYDVFDDEELECYCGVCNFMKCYVSPIVSFFIYKLKEI